MYDDPNECFTGIPTPATTKRQPKTATEYGARVKKTRPRDEHHPGHTIQESSGDSYAAPRSVATKCIIVQNADKQSIPNDAANEANAANANVSTKCEEEKVIINLRA